MCTQVGSIRQKVLLAGGGVFEGSDHQTIPTSTGKSVVASTCFMLKPFPRIIERPFRFELTLNLRDQEV